jgi:hypothetical protein
MRVYTHGRSIKHVDVAQRRSTRQVLLLAAAVAGLSAVPASAAYAPHWYENGKLIMGSVSVETRGTLLFEPPSTQGEPSYIRCRDVVANWTLTNPSSGEAGTGELTSVAASCRARPVRCTAASAGIEGIPKRASLVGDKSEIKETLEDMSMWAECSTAGFGGGGRESGYLDVTITRRGVMHLFGTFYGCNPHEFPICEFHPAFATGKLTLPNNITAK